MLVFTRDTTGKAQGLRGHRRAPATGLEKSRNKSSSTSIASSRKARVTHRGRHR
jgi:hypothetical protein